jgi:hypothetical protein
VIIPSRRRTLALGVAGLSTIGGGAAALYYHRVGLTLSHYDARGHLVVARRIFDSITPGWQQVGAVWLPLPHLLNALPIQIDALYRTGASAVAISILAFAAACAAIAWIVAELTDSSLAGVAGALVFAVNPNVVYLQATPMTELLLIALLVIGVGMLLAWVEAMTPSPVGTRRLEGSGSLPSGHVGGVILALACLTRYEAWPVTAAACTLAFWSLWWNGRRIPESIRAMLPIAAYPVAAVVGFMIFSRIVGGTWFADDFFVPENKAQGLPWDAIKEIVWGVRTLSGPWLLALGAAGLAILLVSGVRHAPRLLPLALLTTAAVPLAAFIDGHPYRIRYMVPLLAAQAIGVGVVAGSWKRARIATLLVAVVAILVELQPLASSAAMVAEAQWDRPNIAGRAPVTTCLAEGYRGETVMASMGSLGHYMQDLSGYGFRIRDFLHEGNGDIWLNALEHPVRYAGWLMIEEKAEGGDMLAHLAREHPSLLDGFSRVCEGAGVVLYRRLPPNPHAVRSGN